MRQPERSRRRKAEGGRRRDARQVALQYHFWRDMQHGDSPEKIEDFWEFLPTKPRVREFAQPLIDGMNTHLAEIDERIRRYAENYEFRRIAASRGLSQRPKDRALCGKCDRSLSGWTLQLPA